jgi:intein/homing endonuclease
MRIATLEIVNFKGYENTKLNFNRNLSLLYGSNGIGKCLSGNELCQVKGRGMVRVDSLFDGLDLRVDSWYDREFDVGVNGDYGRVRKIYYAGEKETVTIRTKRNYTLTGSKDLHQVLTVRDGQLKFVRLSDLTKTDVVAISRRGVFNDIGCCHQSYIAGYLVSEGYCEVSDYRFHNNDLDVISDFENSCQSIGLKYRTAWYGQRGVVRLSSSDAKSLHDLGLSCRSGEKFVPNFVSAGSKESTAAFLSAYFEGDGGIDGNCISCASKSHELLRQVHLLLLRLGIISTLSKKMVKKLSYCDKGYESWRIFISGEDVVKFAKTIGFRSSRKKAELDDLLLSMSLTQRNPNYDVIPITLWRSAVKQIRSFMVENEISFKRDDYKNKTKGLYWLQNNLLNRVKTGLSLQSIKKCIATVNMRAEKNNGDVITELNINEILPWIGEDYYFDRIDGISYGHEKLYDLCVDNEHCFWSNGFISHNSSVLEAVNLVCNPRIFDGRPSEDTQRYLRSLVLDDSFEPLCDGVLTKPKKDMRLDAFFDVGPRRCRCILTNTGFTQGYESMIPIRHGSHAFYVDADNASNLAKFQIADSESEKFVKLAEAIYGYEVDLDGDVRDGVTGADGVRVEQLWWNDLILTKGSRKVHYVQMSAGEKKIATMLRQLCNVNNTGDRWIILIDNIEMHCYYKRHAKMLDALLEAFPDKQIIATTHSQQMIEHVGEDSRFDLEELKDNQKKIYEETERLKMDIIPIPCGESMKYNKYRSGLSELEFLKSVAIQIDLDEDAKNEPNIDPMPSQYRIGMLKGSCDRFYKQKQIPLVAPIAPAIVANSLTIRDRLARREEKRLAREQLRENYKQSDREQKYLHDVVNNVQVSLDDVAKKIEQYAKPKSRRGAFRSASDALAYAKQLRGQ